MNRFSYFLFPLFFLLHSCNREVMTSFDLIFEIENQSSKDIFYCAETDVGNKCIQVNSQNNESMKFRKEKKSSIEIFSHTGDVTRRNENIDISYSNLTIYNLTDTSKYGTHEYGAAIDSLFYNAHRDIFSGNSSNVILTKTAIITDLLLLDITQKDYAMLDKFKEYYANE